MNNHKQNKRCDVIVMAPLDVINEHGKPSYLKEFSEWCSELREGRVDGVMIDVWWGLVEISPKNYRWSGYEEVFKAISSKGLKIIPVLSFHQCSGNVGDTVHIPIPSFVFKHEEKPYFVDKFGNENDEYISFAYDTVKVGKRTPLEMYRDFMISFKKHFCKYIDTKSISKIEVGLGPCGELRYPSYVLTRWEFPGSGSFQCYDERFIDQFKEDAKKAGHEEWTSPPTDTGDSYNEFPGGPEFWRTGYTTDFGKYFMGWYTDKLIEHGRNVLSIARGVFEKTKLSGKVAGIHWQYMHHMRCAEATAGYYNTSYHNSYSKIASMFKENDIDLCFTCLEMTGKDYSASSDPEGLVSEVLHEAQKHGLEFEGENAIERYDWSAYKQIINWVSKGLSTFTFLRMTKKLMEDKQTWDDFKEFTRQMHNDGKQDKEDQEYKPTKETETEKNNKKNNSKNNKENKEKKIENETDEKENIFYLM